MKKEIYNHENWRIYEYPDKIGLSEYLVELHCPNCNEPELFYRLNIEATYRINYIYMWISTDITSPKQLKGIMSSILLEYAHYFLLTEIEQIPELQQANQKWHKDYFELTERIAKKFVEKNKEMKVEDIYQLKKEDPTLKSFVLKYIKEKAKQ